MSPEISYRGRAVATGCGAIGGSDPSVRSSSERRPPPMYRAVHVDQRTPDLERRFAVTDPGAAREARRSLVASLAAVHGGAGEERAGLAACHLAPSVGESDSRTKRVVVESRNA
jgi:hypothetical protein